MSTDISTEESQKEPKIEVRDWGDDPRDLDIKRDNNKWQPHWMQNLYGR